MLAHRDQRQGLPRPVRLQRHYGQARRHPWAVATLRSGTAGAESSSDQGTQLETLGRQAVAIGRSAPPRVAPTVTVHANAEPRLLSRTAHDRFRVVAISAVGRGRVETSNLRDHAVSARSEALRIAAAALCVTAGADGFDRGGFESCAADVLGSSFCAFYRAAREGIMPSSLASAVRFP